jgi:hypothetical protein
MEGLEVLNKGLRGNRDTSLLSAIKGKVQDLISEFTVNIKAH